MPYKDLDRQRAANRDATRKWRAKNRAIQKERDSALRVDAVWYGADGLGIRKLRQRAGVCVVCCQQRPPGRFWCCSYEHELLRREQLG